MLCDARLGALRARASIEAFRPCPIRGDFGYTAVEPVAEAPDTGAIDVGEAGVRGYVEEDVGGLLKLRAQQGVLDTHAARPK